MSIQDSAGLIAERSCRSCNDYRSTDSRQNSYYLAAASATDDNDDYRLNDLLKPHILHLLILFIK